ncbi:MAG: acyl-CoA carboxylase subunit beta [Opitutaceae bacterium]|jgi:propionyl-CoA carboxylase beta chain|nr:acyl-CoA carboxylase subunit beta [Opitutaceae bacterium]
MPIDPKLLERLRKEREAAFAAGGPKKVAARHEKGLLTARERIAELFTPGTFMESGLHAQHQCEHFGLAGKPLPCDGVITGTGHIDGRPVAAFAQDFTVGGGALGQIHAKKICDTLDFALQSGIPVIGINDSGGARIQEGDDALSGYGQIFFRNVLLSGVVPQISVIAGPCAGGAAYSPALTDFIIMTKRNAQMFICGPDVIKAATGEDAKPDLFATAAAHASISGNIHFVAEDGPDAFRIIHKLLSYLPQNNMMEPPHHPSPSINLEPNPAFNEIVPATAKDSYDVHNIINLLVDGGEFLEVQKEFAKNIVVGFSRIEGIVAGIIANNPAVKAGCLDIDSSDKAARFIRFCNIFNIPLVNLVDVPGFMPGLRQEQGGIIRHGAKMLFAYAASTVPKITLIMRKAYGGAYLAMCSRDLGADLVYAWPTAEVAVMGAAGAVNVLYKDEILAAGLASDEAKAAKAEGKDAKEVAKIALKSSAARAKAAEYAAEYHAKFASPYEVASKCMITDVIEPAQTRGVIAMALRNTLSKRDTRPAKKHGNIPL